MALGLLASMALSSAQVEATNCPVHGIKVVKLPWIGPSSHSTALFERLAIDRLKEASQQAVAEQLGSSWNEIHRLMGRAAQRGLKRREAEPIPHVGIDEIDEKSYRNRDCYLTLVNDLTGSRLQHAAEGRGQDSLDGFWSSLTPKQAREHRGRGLGYVGSLYRFDQ